MTRTPGSQVRTTTGEVSKYAGIPGVFRLPATPPTNPTFRESRISSILRETAGAVSSARARPDPPLRTWRTSPEVFCILSRAQTPGLWLLGITRVSPLPRPDRLLPTRSYSRNGAYTGSTRLRPEPLLRTLSTLRT